MRTRLEIFCILSISVSIASAVYAQKESTSAQQLERIRSEITRFEKQLSENKTKEKSLLQNLQELDYGINLHEKLLKELQNTEYILSNQMTHNTVYFSTLQKQLGSLRADFKKRTREAYKYGKLSFLGYLVESGSVQKSLTLSYYYRVIAQRDAKALAEVAEKSRQAASLQKTLETDLQKQQLISAETKSETLLLQKKKNERQNVLYALRDANKKMQETLAERRQAEQSILNEIARIVKTESAASAKVVLNEFPSFSRTKGTLHWPVSGIIVSHIGIEYNPSTKNETVNHGIDIVTESTADVQAVYDGRVAKIKWLPWYGQTVFLQHSEGYYTVYARLSEIAVSLNEKVTAGSSIGKTGKDIVTNQFKLHFQIWHGADVLDPEAWLAAGKPTVSVSKMTAKKKIAKKLSFIS